jgi:hypothetical protein
MARVDNGGGAESEGVVLVEDASPGTRRALSDAGCAVLDGTGFVQRPRRRPVGVVGMVTATLGSELVRRAMAALDRGEVLRWAVLDQRVGAGRTHDAARGASVARHPVELLEWLVTQPEIPQSGIRAYLNASDPDDILPRLPYFLGTKDEGVGAPEGPERLVTRACCATMFRSGGGAAPISVRLVLPGGRGIECPVEESLWRLDGPVLIE